MFIIVVECFTVTEHIFIPDEVIRVTTIAYGYWRSWYCLFSIKSFIGRNHLESEVRNYFY